MEQNIDIINNWLKVYMIGPMESVASGDGGRGWREDLSNNFKNRFDINGNPVYLFDPTLEEQNKTGFKPESLHKKMKGWLAGGNNDLVEKYATLIWRGKTYIERTKEGQAKLVKILGDIDYVINSNFLIARMEKNDNPCGTFAECGIAVEHNIPIYVIQTMARTEYPGSFVHFVFASGGQFFNSEKELFEFIDTKYNLSLKE